MSDAPCTIHATNMLLDRVEQPAEAVTALGNWHATALFSLRCARPTAAGFAAGVALARGSSPVPSGG